MKNLFFAIMAILLINASSYAGDAEGENMKGECIAGIQSTRFQQSVDNGEATPPASESDAAKDTSAQ